MLVFNRLAAQKASHSAFSSFHMQKHSDKELRRFPNTTPRDTRAPIFATLFALFILLGAVIRIPYLTHYPPQLHNDEAASAIGITTFAEPNSGWALYGSGWAGHPNLNYWLSSLPTKVTGELSTWSIRFATAVEGVFSLLFFGLAIANVYGRRASLFFLLFAVPFHLHVHYSRTGFIYNHATLCIALVTWALARVVRTPTARNFLLLGILTGLSVLVYPATHVLAPAMIGAAIIQRLLTSAAPRAFLRELRLTISNILCALIGFTVAAGPQIYFWITQNYESRARSQLIFLPGPRKHIEYSLGRPATDWDLILFNLKHTLLFFWAGDKAAQYGYTGAPLGPIMSWIAVIGTLVLLYRAARQDLISLYVLLSSIATIIGSVLMVEGSFSPHLIIFALLMPLACAVACDVAWKCVRVKHPLIVAPCMLAVGAWWAHWNFWFYETNVQRWNLYRVTYILNLPIETRKIKTVLSLTNTPESLGESFYLLTFPNATRTALAPPQDDAAVILEHGIKTGFPVLAVIELDREASVVEKLTVASHKPTVFRHSQGAVLLVE